MPQALRKNSYKIDIGYKKTCECNGTNINCLTAKDWLKCQLGVWQFTYEKRDVRDKELHPATFPISLAKKVIELFTHQGELVLDPFVGSGTTLVAAQDSNRNAVGFDLLPKYVDLCESRLNQNHMFNNSKQIAIQDDARNIHKYFDEETISLIWTSPPYLSYSTRITNTLNILFKICPVPFVWIPCKKICFHNLNNLLNEKQHNEVAANRQPRTTMPKNNNYKLFWKNLLNRINVNKQFDFEN